MSFGGDIQLTHGHEYEFGTTQYHQLGQYAVTPDGRGFRYVQAGSGAALVAGNAIQAAAQITAHQAIVPTVVAAVGDFTITATLGAAAAAVNQYAGGFAIPSTGPGNGYLYRISGHAAVLSAGVITVNLQRDSPIQVAWSAATRVDLIANPYSGVIQMPITTLTGAVVGVAISAIPASQFGWLQTHGPCPALVAGTPGVGLAVVAPGTAAGAFVIDGAAAATPVVGMMMATGVDGKNQCVMLMID